MFAAWALCVSGCHSLTSRHSTEAIPYTTQPPVSSDVNQRAQHLNSRGLRAFEIGNLAKAEQLFREALEVDVNFGPAHNNLGQIYLARHQLYLAAWEFEYAANLMPELVEPIINQGLAYETGERMDRAAEIYQEAYNRQSNHPVAIASLVRARIKQDADPYEIAYLLDELIMHDGRREWVEWAKELRATKYRDGCLDCETAEDSSAPSFDSSPQQDMSGALRDQLVPMDQVPDGVLVPTDIEELPLPANSILAPANNDEGEDAPSPDDQSNWSNERARPVEDRPTRLPQAAKLFDRGSGPPGKVRPASFESPIVMPKGITP